MSSCPKHFEHSCAIGFSREIFSMKCERFIEILLLFQNFFVSKKEMNSVWIIEISNDLATQSLISLPLF